jgi:Na+(H+)/acetate symporter ActP
LGLLFNGLLKVPMQFFILLTGVMVFVFYQFNSSPLNFSPIANEAVINSEYYEEYKELEAAHKKIEIEKRTLVIDGVQEGERALIAELNLKDRELKKRGRAIIDRVDDASDKKIDSNDKDYVFIHFILNNLPKGIVGLLLAVILAAAMSSTASELNALASTTTIDVYKRNIKKGRDEAHYVKASKLMTVGWGVLSIIIACVADLFDNLIQLVNTIGSIFYGSVLGIFLLAFFVKFVKANAVFFAGLIGQLIIIAIYFVYIFIPEQDDLPPKLPYLLLNVIGAGIVIGVAVILQLLTPAKPYQDPEIQTQ